MNTANLARRVGLLPLVASAAMMLSSCAGEPVAATVTHLEITEAHTEPDRECNGDPVLIICKDTTVEVPVSYSVTIKYPETLMAANGEKSDYAGESCHKRVSAEEYQQLKIGHEVLLEDPVWTVCGVKDWRLPKTSKQG